MLKRYLSRAKAAVVLGIVDDAELPWGHAMNGLLGMDDVLAIGQRLYRGTEIVGRVANLECYVGRRQALWLGHPFAGKCQALIEGQGEGVEVAHLEVLLVGCLRVIAVRDV